MDISAPASLPPALQAQLAPPTDSAVARRLSAQAVEALIVASSNVGTARGQGSATRYLLEVGGERFEVQGQAGLLPGTRVVLRAIATDRVRVEQVLAAAGDVRSTTLKAALREALPRQVPLRDALLALQRTVGQQGVPIQIREQVRRLIGSLPAAQQLFSAAGLKKAVSESGLFHEAGLRQLPVAAGMRQSVATTGSAMPTTEPGTATPASTSAMHASRQATLTTRTFVPGVTQDTLVAARSGPADRDTLRQPGSAGSPEKPVQDAPESRAQYPHSPRQRLLSTPPGVEPRHSLSRQPGSAAVAAPPDRESPVVASTPREDARLGAVTQELRHRPVAGNTETEQGGASHRHGTNSATPPGRGMPPTVPRNLAPQPELSHRSASANPATTDTPSARGGQDARAAQSVPGTTETHQAQSPRTGPPDRTGTRQDKPLTEPGTEPTPPARAVATAAREGVAIRQVAPQIAASVADAAQRDASTSSAAERDQGPVRAAANDDNTPAARQALAPPPRTAQPNVSTPTVHGATSTADEAAHALRSEHAPARAPVSATTISSPREAPDSGRYPEPEPPSKLPDAPYPPPAEKPQPGTNRGSQNPQPNQQSQQAEANADDAASPSRTSARMEPARAEPAAAHRDLKAALLSLLASLRPLTSSIQPRAAAPAAGPMDQVSNMADALTYNARGLLSGSAASDSTAQRQIRSAPSEGIPEQKILDVLRQSAEAAVSRTHVNQIRSLHDISTTTERAAPISWHLEIPIGSGADIDSVELHIEDQGRNESESGAARLWQIMMRIDISTLGPMHALLQLAGARLSATLWAENPATLRAVESQLGSLSWALERAGVTLQNIGCLPGAPPPRASRLFENILDVRV